tara:strand:- start:1281 stop:1460 length:180 start_codon:yes stop_codon:yes gene_type:complete
MRETGRRAAGKGSAGGVVAELSGREEGVPAKRMEALRWRSDGSNGANGRRCGWTEGRAE